jgi:hypothetical protein
MVFPGHVLPLFFSNPAFAAWPLPARLVGTGNGWNTGMLNAGKCCGQILAGWIFDQVTFYATSSCTEYSPAYLTYGIIC